MSCFWDRVSLYRPYISIELSQILGLIRRPWASVRKSQCIETAELAIHEKQRGLSEGHGWDNKRRARYSRCSEESSGESDSRQTRQPSAMTGIHSCRMNPYCQIEHVHNDSDVVRRVAIVAGIIVARHLETADDLFGGPQGSPRTDKMVAAAIQRAQKIMQKIDSVVG